MSLYICLNSQNVQHQECIVMQTMDASDYDASTQVHPLDQHTVGDADNRGGCACVGGRGYVGNLCAFPSIYCEPKIALEN